MPVIRLCRALLLLALLLAAAWLASATGPPAGVETARAQEPDQQGLPWPQRRFAPCAAFDDARGAWYVFGGRGEGGGVHFADTWRIDVRDHAPRWRRVTDAGAAGAPPPLRSCAAAFDHDSRRMLVFGGWDGVTATNGVWALTPGASPRWERLCDGTSCGAPPTARRAAQAIYDPVGRRLLVFGGLDTQYRNDIVGARARRLPRLAPPGDDGVAAGAARRPFPCRRPRASPRVAVRRNHERTRPRRHVDVRSHHLGVDAGGNRRLSSAAVGSRAGARLGVRPARAPRRLGVDSQPLSARHMDTRGPRWHAEVGARADR